MPEIWGTLPKSQIDAETIDEAIASAIADHEADPDAHVEEGESLQSHKASEIIDHVAGSIVGDKVSAKQRLIETNFENIALFATSGDVSQPGFGQTSLYVYYGETNNSQVSGNVTPIPGDFDCDDDFMFEVVGFFDYSGAGTVNLDMAYASTLKVGFVKDATGWRGYITHSGGTEYTEYFYSGFMPDFNLRLVHFASEKVLEFRLDGELVDSIDTTDITSAGQCDFRLKLSATASGAEGSMNIATMKIAIG